MPDNHHSARRPLEAVFYGEAGQLACCLIRRARYMIGHDSKNEIVLREASISARHARLSVEADDEIYIEDLGSANGTFVDGIAAAGVTRLSFDSEIRLGAV